MSGRGRTSLDLYANVIHCQSLPGVETRHRDIDILIVRENTEGEYSSLEHEVGHAHTPAGPRPCRAMPPAGLLTALPWVRCPGHAPCSLATPPAWCGPKLILPPLPLTTPPGDGHTPTGVHCLVHAPSLSTLGPHPS